MRLLNEDFAESCYNEIYEISKDNIPPDLKVPKYRRLFESIFKEIAKGEQQSFAGRFSLYGIIVFITDKYSLPSEILTIIHNFRKLANIIIHDSKFNERIKISLQNIEKFCIKSLCEAVLFFAEVEIPDYLHSLYKDLKEFPDLFTKKTDRELLSTIVTFFKISDPKENLKNQTYFTINCESEEDGNQFLLNIFSPFEYIGHNFRKYTKAYLYNVAKSPNYDNLYNTNDSSLIVIEPDYLIESRALSECFQRQGENHYLYFIDKFLASVTSREMVIGFIVNNLLDKYILEDDIDLKETFNKSIDILQCLQLTSQEIDTIEKEIEEKHLKNIIKFSQECKRYKPIIEPTFISPKFGLYGRLDIMLIRGKNQKDVIELKSGRPPDYDPWINHKMQVTAYNMLLDSTFSKRIGTSCVFYSKAESEYLKNVIKDFSLYKKLINLRNKIVQCELSISEKDFSIFNKISNFDCSSYPDFIKEKFNSFGNIYNNLSEIERAYFHNFIYFIYNELKASKIGTAQNYEGANNGFASLWLDSIEEKIDNSIILHNLKYRKYDSKNNSYIFELNKRNALTNFREGDICIIHPQNDIKPYKETQIYKGSIIILNNDIVVIKLRNNQLSEDIFKSHEYWSIEHDLMEMNYNNQMESLFEFLCSEKTKKELLLCLRKPETEKIDYKNKTLNKNLEKIITKFKSAKDYFLLQGPPGTGKTSLALLKMIEETFIDNPNAKIAVLAYTNRAVDEIGKNLLNFPDERIRNCIGIKSEYYPKFNKYIRIGSEYLDDKRLLQKLAKDKKIDEIKEIINNCNIFISTVSSFQSKYKDILPSDEIFDVIFIDEASQITEPQIIGLLTHCKKFVLIGDHCQLPAVILQDEIKYKVQNNVLQKTGLKFLSMSLFERLFIKCQEENWDYAFDILTVHYRMHNDIANLIKKTYSDRLEHCAVNQIQEQNFFSSISSNPIENLLSRSRTIFIPTTHNRIESKYSTEEAKKIKIILDTIIGVFKNKITKDKIGIITPWRIQINEIRKQINNENILDNILIDTVERFQGSERDIIIISLAVNNRMLFYNLQSENFNKTVDRKLNVALSRAREYLILLGCEQIINMSPHYKRIIEIIRESSGYITKEESKEYFKV